MYHHVSSESPPWLLGAVASNDFEREIAHLCKVTRIVPIDWLVNQLYQGRDIPSKAVCITFDDGYKDNYNFAYPILRKYNAPATIFLTTGYIESSETFWDYKLRFAVWNTGVTTFDIAGLGSYRLKSPRDRLLAMNKIQADLLKLPEREKNLLIEKLLKVLGVDIPNRFGERFMLSWEEILEMIENGISFGAHTVTHPTLTRLAIEEAREEIIRSKRDIEERLGKPCTLFAYPNGDFNTEIIELVKESGFQGAVTTIPRMIRRGDNLFRLGRISAGPDFYTFKGSLSGLYPDLVTALNRFKRR
jgi:peptidoglycan/xylan/chitin deacetylase (PgdA/CDA1 family)